MSCPLLFWCSTSLIEDATLLHLFPLPITLPPSYLYLLERDKHQWQLVAVSAA